MSHFSQYLPVKKNLAVNCQKLIVFDLSVCVILCLRVAEVTATIPLTAALQQKSNQTAHLNIHPPVDLCPSSPWQPVGPAANQQMVMLQ